MAETAVSPAETEHHEGTPRTYWLIALLLAVLTAIEVAVTYVEVLQPVEVPLLIILGVIKFAIVIMVFMHLKYDAPLFRMLFLIGVFGAVVLYMVVLATFNAL